MRGEDARTHHLKTMSGLVPLAPQWRVGVGYEFLERPDGYRGWTERYGLNFGKQPSVLDLGLVYRALAEKKVDIVAGNSTDGLIAALDLFQLADDKHYFPPYQAVMMVRQETLTRVPAVAEVLNRLNNLITTEEMRKMNYAVDHDKRTPKDVAQDWIKTKGL